MATIESSIALYDNFSPVLNNIMDAMNLTIATVHDMQSSMSGSVDTSSIEAAENAIHQAGAAMEVFNQQLQNSGGNSNVDAVTPEPVQVPVHWQVDNMEVFTNTGAERFQQEVQSANTMLNILNQTQAQITATAGSMDILPPQASIDMMEMQNRIQEIQQRIMEISGNPVNLGTDQANIELEQLGEQLSGALEAQSDLNAALENLDASGANAAYLRLSNTVSNTERYIRDNVDEQGRFNNVIQQGTNQAAALGNMIRSAFGAFLGIAGIRKAISFISDSTELYNTQLNAENQLMAVLANMLDDDYVTNYMIETQVSADTAEAINEINAIKNNVDDVEITVQARTGALQAEFDAITTKASEIQGHGIYGDEAMIAGAAELSTYFTDAEAITMMMDTLSNYAMGMSGGGELDATAMVDYATGLGKVMSGAYDAMTKKGFEFTEAQKAVIEGTATEAQITEALGAEYADMSSDMQAAAAITQVIDESWAGLYETMSNTPQGKIIQMTNGWGDMKEMVGKQLYPYIILFVDTITDNWPTIQSVLDGFVFACQRIMTALNFLLQGAIKVIDLLVSGATFVYDNWDLIGPMFYAVAGALAFLTIAAGINTLALKAQAFATGAATLASKVHSAALARQQGVTFGATVQQYGLNAALLACPITWIVIGIFAIIAAIGIATAVINKVCDTSISATGMIGGCIFYIMGALTNCGLLLDNILFGAIEAAKATGHNIKEAFTVSIKAVEGVFYGLAAVALGVISDIAAELAKLPFVTFDAAGLSTAAGAYAAEMAAKAKEAADYTPDWQDIGAAWDEGFNTYEYLNLDDEFDRGYEWAKGLADKISETLDSALENPYDFDPNDYLNGLDSAADNAGNAAANTADIAENTADIADALDIMSEELKYLRDITERDIIDRTVYRDIIVNVGGMQNTVKNEADLDGIASKLANRLTEQIKISAEGA